MIKSNLIRHLSNILFFLLYIWASQATAIEVGGIQFDDNAFSDAILSTDYTGGLVNAATLEEALLGTTLSTYIDYDIPPLGQDPSTYTKDLRQYIELGFIDNDVYNGEGNDLVFFEAGSPNAIYVCLNTTYQEEISIIVPTNYRPYDSKIINVGYLDLSVLGVPEGEKIDRITVSSWRTPQDGTGYGVPEIAAVGALHSTSASNRAPVVEAGSDIVISFPENSVQLSATVSDDGLPGSAITIFWQQIDGPAVAVIDTDSSAATLITFDTVGTYHFEITADDGEFTTSDMITITVTAPDNQPPEIVQGVNGQALSYHQIQLSWQESTDNVAVSGYRIYRDGAEIATVNGILYTDSGLSALTSYSYYIEAFDEAGNESLPSNSISVTTSQQSLQLEARITSSSDDSEEGQSGRILLTSSDLELVDDVGAGNQLVGLRFANISIPQGAHIDRAWIEFETDETGSAATSLSFTAENSDNAPAFTAAAYDISNRFTVNASVPWDAMDPWTTVNEKHQSPDLSTVLQQVINRGGWVAGNAVVFIISGQGTRTAESYEGEAGAASLLHVEYSE